MNKTNVQSPIWLCVMLDQSEDLYDGEDGCAALCFEPNALYHLIWKSEQADRHAARVVELFPDDYLEWGTVDVDCAAVDWGVLVAVPGFWHENGRGVLVGELPGRGRLMGYAKVSKRNDQDVLRLSFTDADEGTDWTTCHVGKLVAWVDGVAGRAGRKALARETVDRLATLYEYTEGDLTGDD